MEMSNEIEYPWQRAVLDAFLVPHDALPTKINAAQKAISARLIEPQQPDFIERIAIDDALRALKVLLEEAPPRRVRANNPKREDVA
jgi:hypothetical protein